MRRSSLLTAFSVLALALSLSAGCAAPATEEVATTDTTDDELVAAREGGVSLDEARAIVAFAKTASREDLEHAGLPAEGARALVMGRATRRLVTVKDVQRIVVMAAPDLRTKNAAQDALCEQYKKLAGGAHIAALVCGQGPCWPLSSWYGYWSRVYSQLAEAVCAKP